MTRSIHTLLFGPLAGTLLCSASLFAQNDNCAQAVTLIEGTSCSPAFGTVSGATQSLAAINCNGYTGTANDDVWYKFVATATDATVQLTCNASFDGVIDVRSGSCNGSNIACADGQGTGGDEAVYFTGLTMGNTYYIRVYDYGTGYPSDPGFTICVWSTNAVSGPANDNCAQAITLTMGNSCTPVSGSVDQATQSLAAIDCGGFSGDANDDVWYKFVATAANANIELTGGATFDGVLDLRSGACNGTNIACGDQYIAGGAESINATGLTVGSTYYIRVYDYASGYPAEPTFDICVYAGTPPPGNDMCSGATVLTANSTACTPVTGDVANSNAEVGSNCIGDNAYDLWYRFVAPGPTVIVRVDGSTSFDAVYEFLQGSNCNNLSYQDCINSTGNGGIEEYQFQGLTTGSTYYVRVYPYDPANTTTTTFTICAFSPPAFDECGAATPLTMQAACNPVNGDAAGATNSGVFSNCNGQGESDDDVWYSFVATGGDVRITVDGNGTYDPIVHLRYGCPGSSIACANQTGAGGTETLEFQGITAGNTYYVQIYDAGTGQPSNTTFSVCVQDISSGIGVEEQGLSGSPWQLRSTNDPYLWNLASARNLRTDWSVFDATGRQVVKGSSKTGPATTAVLDMRTLSTGAYTLVLSGEGQQATERFILP